MFAALKNKKSAIACGLVLSIASATRASTLATYDLEAMGTSDPKGAISNNDETITLSTPGSTIIVGLYLVLHGSDSNPANDGGLNIKGSFVGPTGGLLGNFTTGTQQTGFGGPTSQGGTLINSNNTNPATYNLGDDMTLGTAPTTPSDAFITTSTNSSSGYAGVTYGTTLDANGNTDLLVGETTFTLLSTDAGGSSTLTFIPTYSSSGVSGRNQEFVVDANLYEVNALGNGNEYVDGVGSAQSVSGVLDEEGLTVDFATPEPSSFGLLALGGLAMLRRRRTSSGLAASK